MPYWHTLAGQRLLTIFGRQPVNSTASETRWLHAREQRQLEQFTSADRRMCWLRGRLAIKQLIQQLEPQQHVPAELEIISYDKHWNLGCAPRVFASGDELQLRPALTHSLRHYAACIAHDSRHRPGIDLVEHADLNLEQLRFWLRADERERLAQFGTDTNSACRALARLWGGKEAAFKTLPIDTRFQPQQLVILAWDTQQTKAAWHTVDELYCGALRWDELPNLTLTLAVRNE